MDIKIVSLRSSKLLTIDGVAVKSDILYLKKIIAKKNSISPERICLRTEPKGKNLSDSVTISELGKPQQLYFKDLGPQVSWSFVFLCEYAGPILFYLISYIRPTFLYGTSAINAPYHKVVHIAAICWSFHYAKRILETIFVHRFSHATMPIMNLFKNCTYYWGFAFYVGYFINHPLYTPPMFNDKQIYLGLAGFILSELGNFSIHMALRNLRPPGTKERKIPQPTSNPFTFLFSLVSCPNYTYEVGSWISFSVMTQALPALIFTLAGGGQMLIWALGKHRAYKIQFPDYPRSRKAMIPFFNSTQPSSSSSSAMSSPTMSSEHMVSFGSTSESRVVPALQQTFQQQPQPIIHDSLRRPPTNSDEASTSSNQPQQQLSAEADLKLETQANKENKEASDADEVLCVICQDYVTHPYRFFACKHEYHASCLRQMLNSDTSDKEPLCPQCRKPIDVYDWIKLHSNKYQNSSSNDSDDTDTPATLPRACCYICNTLIGDSEANNTVNLSCCHKYHKNCLHGFLEESNALSFENRSIRYINCGICGLPTSMAKIRDALNL